MAAADTNRTGKPVTDGTLRRISFRQLIYFRELCRFMNFRKASESLNVSQPTLSQQIAQLEQSTEVSLLHRSSRGFRLTKEGQQFETLCKDLIELGSKGLADIKIDLSVQPLRIGVPSYQSYRQIDNLLAGFQKAHPSIFTHLIEMNAVEMCDALRSKQLDLAFMSYPTPLELPKNLDSLTVVQSRYEFCIAATHPIAKLADISVSDMADLPLILLPQQPHKAQFQFQIDALKDMGIRPNIYPSSLTNVSAQISLAASGVGACLVVPDTMDIGNDVVTRQSDPPLPNMKMALFWEKKSLHPSVERLVSFAQRLLG